jgi:hypothetical protein
MLQTCIAELAVDAEFVGTDAPGRE